MVNIEEPPPTPDALNLSSIINSNSFNESNASLNNYRYKTNS